MSPTLVAPFLNHFALLLTRPPTPFCVWVVPGLTQQLLPFTPTLVSRSPELSASPASLVVSTKGVPECRPGTPGREGGSSAGLEKIYMTPPIFVFFCVQVNIKWSLHV